ncbi:MAG TPA: DUF1501 domain-containing protein [Isosphaeraceae bacterium]|nr:DUF1501 domain-containing protein [Isosphaeraceae bacterium]
MISTGQLETHGRLPRIFSSALKAFFDDLAAAKLADRVLVLGFSEFGRRVAENSSAGTDHGTTGLVLLAAQGVQGGIHGKVPSLTDLFPTATRGGPSTFAGSTRPYTKTGWGSPPSLPLAAESNSCR